MRPLILVMPEGNVSRHGADTEWANTRLGRYDDALVDVVRSVDRRFSTIRSRRGRMLAGVSTGGFAAANLTLHHLALFAGFESWSGYFRETRTDAFTDEPERDLVANSPVDDVTGLAAQFRRRPVAAFVYEGDRETDPSHQDLFCARLRGAGGTVTCRRYSGPHGWTLWRDPLAGDAALRLPAPRGGPAMSDRRQRVAVVVAVAAVAVLSLLSALTPSVPGRAQLLEALEPGSARTAGQIASLAGAVLLLALLPGVAHGRGATPAGRSPCSTSWRWRMPPRAWTTRRPRSRSRWCPCCGPG